MDWTLLEIKVNRDYLERNTEPDDDLIRGSLHHHDSNIRPLESNVPYTFCILDSTLRQAQAIADLHGVDVTDLVQKCVAIYLRHHTGT